MKIAFFEVEPWEKRYFTSNLSEHELSFFKDKLSVETAPLANDADIISVFIGSLVNPVVLDQLKAVKMIATRSTGVDHIDHDYCKEKNIVVKNVPHYGVNTVAEHTFSLILALSRKLFQGVAQTKLGDFSNKNLTGFDLYGKTLGIIGLGNIGTRVAELAKAFGMNVLIYTRTPKEIENVKFVDLETLLKEADIVTLHTPLTKETKHLINKNNIKLMKKGAFIVNTARGPLIQTEALVWALKQGIIAGAGLDVLEEEHAIKEETQILTQEYMELTSAHTLLLDHLLLQMPNVIITPHNAFNSREALEEINYVTVQNILSK